VLGQADSLLKKAKMAKKTCVLKSVNFYFRSSDARLSFGGDVRAWARMGPVDWSEGQRAWQI